MSNIEIFVQPSPPIDAIMIEGFFYKQEHFTSGESAYLGLSDGTLLRYDPKNENDKMSIFTKGKGFLKEYVDSNRKTRIFVFDEKLVDWIVFGSI